VFGQHPPCNSVLKPYAAHVPTSLHKEFTVAYSIHCRDAGQDCDFAVTTSTEDELMQHVASHAAAAHPDMELTPETVSQVKSLVTTT
jgi:predicted small metal-binding protein